MLWVCVFACCWVCISSVWVVWRTLAGLGLGGCRLCFAGFGFGLYFLGFWGFVVLVILGCVSRWFGVLDWVLGVRWFAAYLFGLTF